MILKHAVNLINSYTLQHIKNRNELTKWRSQPVSAMRLITLLSEVSLYDQAQVMINLQSADALNE